MLISVAYHLTFSYDPNIVAHLFNIVVHLLNIVAHLFNIDARLFNAVAHPPNIVL